MSAGFRNSRWRDASETLLWGDNQATVQYRVTSSGALIMRVDSGEERNVSLATGSANGTCTMQIDGSRKTFRVCLRGDRALVQVEGTSFDFAIAPRFPSREAVQLEGSCLAPMPGRVVQVLAANGSLVTEGDTLLILEAMKMEHRIQADRSGIVEGLDVQVGDQVSGDQVLAVVGTEAPQSSS